MIRAPAPRSMRQLDLLTWALRTMIDVRPGRFARLLLLMLAGAVAELLTIGSVVPFLSLLSADELPASGGAGKIAAIAEKWVGSSTLLATSLAFMAAALVAAAIRLWLAWSTQRFTLNIGHEITVDIQRRMLSQPYSYHVSQNSSRILASLEKVQLFSSAILLQVVQGISAVVVGLFIIASLIWIDPPVALAAAAILVGSYLAISRLAAPWLTRDAQTIGASYDRRIKVIQESLGGIRDVILDNSRDAYVEEFRTIDRQFVQARLRSGFLATAPRMLLEATGIILLAALAVALWATGRDTVALVPVMGALALGALRLLPLVQQLYQGWASLAANRSIAAEVATLLALPYAQEEGDDTPMGFQRSIDFDKVSLTYPQRDRPAVTNISLSIPQGSRVLLVGKTGSGKSTVVDLLMGLLSPDSGVISVDGTPITFANRRAWQRCIGHVPQSLHLADASIARNVAISEPAGIDRARVSKALEVAQLGPLVATLPQGMDTEVGERGVRLSGGQRQRIGIARAIYKNAPVLVLDEATNAVDWETENAIYGVLDELQKLGRTIIIVTHRANVARPDDIIVRLDTGCVVAVESSGTKGGR